MDAATEAQIKAHGLALAELPYDLRAWLGA